MTQPYNELLAERDRLSAINAELLEALNLADECMSGSTDKTLLIRASKAVRAAIAKAQGEQ